MMGSYTKVANGNIKPSRFVTLDATADFKVLQAGVGSTPYGVCRPETRRQALAGWDDGFAAIAGEQLNIYGPGDPGILLVAGAAFSAGDYLKPDSDGRGVVAATDKDKYGARALASATAAGQLIPVEIIYGERSV